LVYDTKVHGLALFLVNKDLKVTFLDLKLAGIRVTDEWLDRYLKWSDVFTDVELHHRKLLEGCRSTIRICRSTIRMYRNRVLLCKFYISRERSVKMVRAIAIASFTPGLLRVIVNKLEGMGWKRAFLVEVSRWRTKRSVRSW